MQKIRDCCQISFLSGAIRGAAELIFTNIGFAMYFQSLDVQLIQTIKDIIFNIYKEEYKIESSYIDKGYIKGEFHTLRIPVQNAKDILEKCGIVTNKCEIIDHIPVEIISKNCCKSAYLKGLFLSCGSLSAPPETDAGISGKTRAGYHLEFNINSIVVRDDIKKLLISHAQTKENHIRFRASKNGIYIKNAETICNILASMGANNGVLAIQQIITSRAMKNQVNRASNFVLANINKTISAGAKQTEAIKIIENTIGLDNLSSELKETAFLRKNYPDANLSELAQLSSKSKSCINHRLRKLVEIAEGISKE